MADGGFLSDLPPELQVEYMLMERQRAQRSRRPFSNFGRDPAEAQLRSIQQRYTQGLGEEQARYNQLRQGTPGTAPDSSMGFEELGGTPPDPKAAVEMALMSRFPAVQRMGKPQTLGRTTTLPTGETIATDKAWEEERKAAQALQRETTLARLQQAEQAQLDRHQIALQNAKTAEERAAETARHNRVVEELRAQAAEARGLPKPKPGYIWNAEGTEQVLIKGGSEYNKMEAAALKDKQFLDGVANNFEDTVKVINQLVGEEATPDKPEGKPHEGLNIGTGLTGVVARRVPGKLSGGARDFDRLLETLNAKVSFAELGRMRRESPTGGALGQIAVRELELLGQSLRPIDPTQSPEALIKHLKDMRQILRNSVATLRKSYDEGYSALKNAQALSPGGGRPAGSPSIDQLMDKYK